MPLVIDMQIATVCTGLPAETDFLRWIGKALQGKKDDTEIVVRIVDEMESAELNQTYRDKSGATNVLSFPFEAPAEVDINLLGDLIMCAPIIEREAGEQDKTAEAHWAHMAVHGSLHLLGYDHQTDEQAEQMETMETDILVEMGYNAPYV